ncbi:MAG: formimidoylglutamate deiminase, partial [Rhodospirillaceae bacterium]|nr:formimidoylglutamate deiminase [Rhodospirillaceae bacterium]
LTERATAAAGQDSFWTWREVMYAFVGRFDPDQVEAIAAQLYVEMLKAGYTAVGEFHYLHKRPDGGFYDDPAEMSSRIVRAAGDAGIGLTLLPVLYARGGFGGQPPGAAQHRFVLDVAQCVRLIERLRALCGQDPQIRVGVAPHSLRAVTPEELSGVVAGLRGLDAAAPIHIHVAEQVKEVEDCLAWSGRRPVEWLLDHAPVDGHWCLVHATHMTPEETRRLAASGAVAGLCPTTEANLGDGIFPAQDYMRTGGAFGIGSDSHVSVSPVEELRWLEYGQRLIARRRNVLLPEARGNEAGSVGAALYRRALAGGAQALGRPVGRLVPGARADLVVLDPDCPTLIGKAEDALLDAFVFAGNANPVRDVMVGSAWVVRERRHRAEEAVFTRYCSALQRLLA